MKESARTPEERRVLVLAPTAKDGALTESILERADVPCARCNSIPEVIEQLRRGAAALVLPEEAIDDQAPVALVKWLQEEPPWSDLPILVLAQPGADSAGLRRAVELLGNVTILERPTRVAAFVSAIRAALRARRRQYQVRNHLDEREAAARAAVRRSEQLHRLSEVLPLITAAIDLTSVVGILCTQARELIGADRSDATLFGERGGTPLSATSSAYEDPALAPRPHGVLASRVAATNEPLRLDAAGMARAFPQATPVLGGYLAVPLVHGHGRAMGVIQLSGPNAPGFTEEDETLLVQLAQMAAIAIENATLVNNLRDADRRKDEFLAMLAHELRNPLAPLRNSLYLLRLTSQDGRPADASVTEMMERQVNHMVRLVDDLLEVSRITRGKIELRMEDVEITEIVQSAIETSRPAIEAGRHALSLSLPDERLALRGDPVRLGQVFSNLLNNAAKYTDHGGRISLTVKREGNEVAVVVRDTGIGIPAEMLPRVFDLFTQVERHGSRAQGGLGIGLTLVKRLVDLHGGRVAARSDGVGHGSAFEVRLPLATPRNGSAEHQTMTTAAAGVAPRRVLVVDDNHDAAESLGALLSLLGADTRVAFSGPEALEVLPTFRPEVVLLDIGMPVMDGHEVARRIHGLPEFATLPLVALTGWGQQQDREKSQGAGFGYHLIKPADLDALRAVLDSIGAPSATS